MADSGSRETACYARCVPTIAGVPLDFLIFASVLVGIALAHRHALYIALVGLAAVVLYKLVVTGFDEGPGARGLAAHFAHEWVTLANLLALLVGFGLLARHFEESRLPQRLSQYLPDGWRGGLCLLLMIFLLSAFLDNIAAALIGGAMARPLFRERVHVGFLAAIVAAANAGGAGSVIGDTTTTMMWISGVSPAEVAHAYIAAGAALLVFAIPASLQQHRHSPIVAQPPAGLSCDWPRVAIVGFVLACAVTVNVYVNLRHAELADEFPFIGAAVCAALIASAVWRAPDWRALPASLKGAVFLLALVAMASMMPVEHLPPPTWRTTLSLGVVSAVFDNIPLTALALAQGGYDWGFLAYAVGFGGSMMWFGSSAGIALTSQFPEGRSTARWLRDGGHVAAAYFVGFIALLLILGWRPPAGP